MALRYTIAPFVRSLSCTRPAASYCLRFSTSSAQSSPTAPSATITGPESQEQRPGTSALLDATTSAPQANKLQPYHVSRTPTNNLPVYTDIKAGKTLKQTIIRKITGNTRTLRLDLIRELEIDPERIEIGKVTGHVVIKGWCKGAVEQFLKGRGF